MSKNEPNTITTPGASASRSRSTQKVLDIQRRFIDASKVFDERVSFTPAFSPVQKGLEKVSNRFNGFS